MFSLRHVPLLQTATASVVLPIVRRLLAESDWSLRESGVLLLGIIAWKDSSRALVEHWPDVFPALCRGFDDPHSSFRAISCCAARFCLGVALERGVRAVLSSSFASCPFLFRFSGVLCCAVLCFAFSIWCFFASAFICCVVLCGVVLCYVGLGCAVLCCILLCGVLCGVVLRCACVAVISSK